MPRVTSRTSIFVNADREHIFSYVKDMTRHTEWSTDVRKVEKVSPGIIGIGTKFKVEGTGKHAASEVTVTDYENPLRFAYAIKDARGEHEHLFDFHAQDSGTLVEQTTVSKLHGNGLMFRLGMGRPATKAALEKLKAAMEKPVSSQSAAP